MTEHTAHRNLLDAAKLLLHRLEERCSRDSRPWQPDWVVITRAFKAIEESKEALNRPREKWLHDQL